MLSVHYNQNFAATLCSFAVYTAKELSNSKEVATLPEPDSEGFMGVRQCHESEGETEMH